jgi:spermidine/putrescine transport system substrate-binding protein
MGRRSLLLFAGLLAFSLAAVACGNGGTTASPSASGSASMRPEDITGTIRLLSYNDGFDPEYMASFHEQYPNIDLKTSAMSSNEEAVAKIQAGFEVDVINSCVDEAALEMVQKGMYIELDTSRLTYWNDLFPSVKELPGVVVDGKYYVVPVDMGAGGILYNVDVVNPPPDSWADLFDPKWAGRVAVENNATTAMMIGALVTGIPDPLSMDEAQLDQVAQYWIDHKDQFRTFYTQGAQIRTLFKSEEVLLASGYADNAAYIREEGVNVELAMPKEGAILWACGYGISPNIDPANLDAAYALLNWYTSPEAELFEAETWSYQVANQDVLKIASPEVIEAASLEAPMNMENAIPAHPPENRAAWVAAWAEVKAS